MKTERVVALTTEDNPWNYFTDYDSWSAWDESHGYCTESYLDRIAMLSDSLPEELRAKYEEEAIDEIIKVNKGIIPYKKVEDTVESYT